MAISWYNVLYLTQYQKIATPSARNDGGSFRLVLLLLAGQVSRVVGGVMTPPYRLNNKEPVHNAVRLFAFHRICLTR